MRVAVAFALAFVCVLSVGADEPMPSPPPVEVPATGDPLADLMRRVSALEEEKARRQADEATRAAAADKRPKITPTAQIQVDSWHFSQDAANKDAVGNINNGTDFRRARIGLIGDYHNTEFSIAMDYALAGRPTFLDVFAGIKEVPYLGRVRVGHFFEPFLLERYTQNRFVTFMERALPDEPFAPARNTGIMANNTYLDERGTWALGYFAGFSDFYGDDVGDDFHSAVTGRITYLPWYDEATHGRDLMHVGMAGSVRGTKDGTLSFAARPESRLGAATPNVPPFVDTGKFAADSYELVGLELLWIRGPFSMQSEGVYVPVQGTNGSPSMAFSSWYAMASFFLTGENRAYRRDWGVLDRIHPRKDFVAPGSNGGWVWGPGAWEVAVRISQIDLNSGPIQGGRLTDFTFGINWYLNPYARVTANYIRAFQSPADGPAGIADQFGLRVGYEF